MGVHFLTQYRNPLAYPAGYVPGFDPSHIAAKRTIISTVASGGNQINVFRGDKGTITGAPVGGVQAFGPYTYYASGSGDNSSFSGCLVAQPVDFTIGFITNHDGNSSNTLMFDSGSNAGATNAWCIQAFGGRIGLRNSPSFAGMDPATLLEANKWYFTVITQSAALNVINWVFLRLDNGRLETESKTALTAGGDGNGTVSIGGSSLGLEGKHRVAAAMYTQSYMHMAALREWAADPWSFWYPNPGDNWIAAQAASGLFKITGNPRSLAGFGGGLAA